MPLALHWTWSLAIELNSILTTGLLIAKHVEASAKALDITWALASKYNIGYAYGINYFHDWEFILCIS